MTTYFYDRPVIVEMHGNKWVGYPKLTTYAATGGDRLDLVEEDGQPLMTCSICMPDEGLKMDEIIIKDYHENAGIFQTLIEHGIVADTGDKVDLDFCQAPIARLLI